MYEYSRQVHYYETDQMSVVHHSNYLRWMEEARTGFFSEVGLPYEVTEARGVLCPVTGVNIRFKSFARYGDTFTVRLSMPRYTGVRFDIAYTIRGNSGAILAEGESSHAFLSKETFRPVSLVKALPDLHALMLKNTDEKGDAPCTSTR